MRVMGSRVSMMVTLMIALTATVLAAPATPPTALMVSDIHFNPFHDPAKVKQLAAAPASEWEAILSRPDSPTQAQDFAALQSSCKLKGIDTPYSLFSSVIRAIHREAAEARFITISGDMLAHSFDCMFEKTRPGESPEQYMIFTAKTIEYEQLQLRHAVPGAVLYVALGNNDSECGDYRLDTGSEWFRRLAKVAAASVGSAWNKAATESFEQGGYYSVVMPAPMRKTRMIVVNDNYLAGSYKTCKKEKTTAPAEKQMAWLQTQLDEARAHHERVWVMGHIPPGVNTYATFQQQKVQMDLCTPGGKPASFMSTDVLGDILTKNADVVKLGIFGHTHLDEMKLLRGEKGSIPIKNVPSITSIGGNYPSFTVAQIDTATAELEDFTVVSSPDPEGSAWTKEYTFSKAYGHKGFDPATLGTLINVFKSDPGGASKMSQEYIQNWSAGAQMQRLQPIWSAYVCGMDQPHGAEYKSCVCQGPLGPLLGGKTQ